MSEKLIRTPDPTGVRWILGGKACTFRVPHPAEHIPVVVECEALPCAEHFPYAVRVFPWAPQEVGKIYADHAHTVGQEIFVCTSGRIEFTISDGIVEEIVELGACDALFIKTHVWHQLKIVEEGSALLVLSDVRYDREAHYEESFEAFCVQVA